MDNFANSDFSSNDNSVLIDLSTDITNNDGSKEESRSTVSGSYEHVMADKIRAGAEKVDNPVLKEVLKDFAFVLDISKTELIDFTKIVDKELSYRVDGYDEAKAGIIEKIPDSIKEPIEKTLTAIDKFNTFSKMSLPEMLNTISDLIEDAKEKAIENEKNDLEKEDNKVEVNEIEPFETTDVEHQEIEDPQDNLKEIENNDNNAIDNDHREDIMENRAENNIELRLSDMDVNDPAVSDEQSNEIESNESDIEGTLSNDDGIEFQNENDNSSDTKATDEEIKPHDNISDYSSDDSAIAESKTVHSDEEPEKDNSTHDNTNDSESFDKYEKPERLEEPDDELDRKNTEENADITDEALEFDKIDDVPIVSIDDQTVTPEDADFSEKQVENGSQEELDAVDDIADPGKSALLSANDVDGDGTVNEQDNTDPTFQDEDLSADIAADAQTDVSFPEFSEDGTVDYDAETSNDIPEKTPEIGGDVELMDQNDGTLTDKESLSPSDTDGSENTDIESEDAVKDVDNIGDSLDDLSSDWNDDSVQDQELYNNDSDKDEIPDNSVSTDVSANSEIENLKNIEIDNVSDSIENEMPEDTIESAIDFEIPQGFEDNGIAFGDPYDSIQNISDTIDFASEFSDDAILPESDPVDYGMEQGEYDIEIPYDGTDVYMSDLASVDIEEIGELLI